MDYSQNKLIELFKAGKFPGETGIPKHVETFISNVFIFESQVYKFYKNDNAAFNANFRNISDCGTRFEFTKRDFKWNHAMSPNIYTELLEVVAGAESVEVITADMTVEELVIKMNKVDLQDILFEKLVHNQITKEDSFEIGKSLGMSLAKVRTSLPHTFNYYDVFEQRIIDARAWMSSVENLSTDEIDSYCAYLTKFRDERKELFEEELSRQLEYGGDIHSHNALYTNGEFFLMDTYSPKDDWLIEYHGVPAYRVATDMWALTGSKELFEECLRGYESTSGLKIDRRLDSLYVIYALTISAPYHYMLQQTDKSKRDAATRIHEFTKNQFSLRASIR